MATFAPCARSQPLAAVIDLTRLPSHGRYVAAAIRATKSTRHIPIVFVDGDPEKVERVRKDLPDAVYTSRSRLVSALKRVKPLADPVAPPRMMDRTDRTTAEKLGIKAGARVALIDPPADYLRVLGRLPKDASLEEEPGGDVAFDAMVRPRSGWLRGGASGYASAGDEDQDLDHLSQGPAGIGIDAGLYPGSGAFSGFGGLQSMFGERSLDRAAVHAEEVNDESYSAP